MGCSPHPVLAPLWCRQGSPPPVLQLPLWTEGGGSGQKGKCEEFPSYPSSVSAGPRSGGPGSGRAMEPLETPVKDGILYQQHIKFGKVGTLAARWPPRTGSGPLPQTRTGH